MRKEFFRQTGCYLSKCIHSIRKPSTPSSVPPAAAYVYPLKKILYAFEASEKPSTPSSVPPAADYVSPLKKQYWDVQTKNLRKLMAGMNKDKILETIYQLKHEYKAYHVSGFIF